MKILGFKQLRHQILIRMAVCKHVMLPCSFSDTCEYSRGGDTLSTTIIL
jgi:hypothetical protein